MGPRETETSANMYIFVPIFVLVLGIYLFIPILLMFLGFFCLSLRERKREQKDVKVGESGRS